MKKLDAKDILKKLEPETKKVPVSLYLNEALYKQYKKACGKIGTSKVTEELIKEFLVGLK